MYVAARKMGHVRGEKWDIIPKFQADVLMKSNVSYCNYMNKKNSGEVCDCTQIHDEAGGSEPGTR